jgi:hypothetical protein
LGERLDVFQPLETRDISVFSFPGADFRQAALVGGIEGSVTTFDSLEEALTTSTVVEHMRTLLCPVAELGYQESCPSPRKSCTCLGEVVHFIDGNGCYDCNCDE